MSGARALKQRLDRVELPKGGVALLCAAILALPAALALGHSAKLDSQGRWVHHHTTEYTTCNHIDQHADLNLQAGNARNNWGWNDGNPPTMLRFPPETDCHSGPGNEVHIQLQDGYMGNTGWRASSMDDPGANSGYHATHTHIHFNLDASWNNYTSYDRRALVCKELGQVIGVNPVAPASWPAHGQDNDCMSFAGAPNNQTSKNENANNYTYTDRPGGHSADLVDQRYTGHVDTNPPVLQLSGPLVSQQNPIVPSDFEVEFQATDDLTGVTLVRLSVDGQTIDSRTQDCPSEGGGCPFDGVLWAGQVDLAPGPHSYSIVAADGEGNVSAPVGGQFTVDASEPELSLSGSLVDDEGRPAEAGNLDAVATDSGSTVSGIKSIKVSVNATTVVTDESSCSPQCPSSMGAGFAYDRTQWGPGPHTVTITATDRAGNVGEEAIVVDDSPEPEVNCPNVSPTIGTGGQSLTLAQAETAAIPEVLEPADAEYVEEIEETLDPSLADPVGPPSSELDVLGTLNATSDSVASEAAGEVVIGNVACLVPMQSTAAETDATIVEGDSALYANSAPDTDTIVRPTPAGEAIVQSVRGAAAPSTYEWRVGLAPGLELRALPSGRIAVVDPSEPAQPSILVPPEPAGADDPDYLGDVETQYADAWHQAAAAEQESNSEVVAVFPEPYVVLSDGQTEETTASLLTSDTIAVDSHPDARAVALIGVAGPAKCYESNGVTTTYGGVEHQTFVNNLTCIVDRQQGVRATWKGQSWSPGVYPTMNGKFRVTLNRRDNQLVRSKQHANPVIDWAGKQWWTSNKRGTARWCAKLRNKTMLPSWTVGIETVTKVCGRMNG